MKKIIYFLFFIVSMSFSSCNDYLEVDKYLNDMLNVDTVFNKKNYTEQWLWNTYAYLRDGGAEITNKYVSAFSFASDDCIFGDGDELCEKYQNGQFSSSDQLYEDRWLHLYKGIRQASIFIHNIDNCTELKANVREDYRAQARFLRAYFYWMLIKQYGPVPIIEDQGHDISQSYDKLSVPRNTYDECVEFITSELVQAARVLPLTRSSVWLGQATRGAALATRAKVLLYAASPLYNGNTQLSSLKDNKGNSLINQEYSEEKWAKAAAAAKDVIDLNEYELLIIDSTSTTIAPASNVKRDAFPPEWGDNAIDHYESYRQCFNGEVPASKNRELIFTRQNYSGQDINNIIYYALPTTLNGMNTICATQKQVDAYYMADGRTINNSSTAYPYRKSGFTQSPVEEAFLSTDVSLMYARREPRFYASIAFSGAVWENLSTTEMSKQNRQIFYYKGTNDGKKLMTPENYLRTGIGVKKYYNPNDSWNEGGARQFKVEPTIRYADVLLWYAEALNEIKDGKSYQILSYNEQTTHTILRDVNGMRYGFSRVHYRAGLPDLGDDIYADQTAFRSALKKERQIEFFLESARYFDLRRWKDAAEEENMAIMGLNVDMGNTRVQKPLFYQPQPASMKKVFINKMYLWPIPLNDMTNNEQLTQNPGW